MGLDRQIESSGGYQAGRPAYFDKEEEILRRCKGRCVLHLGCVGYADLPANERVRLIEQTLHYKLSKVADVTGIDYSSDVVNDPLVQKMFGNVRLGNAEKLDQAGFVGQSFDFAVAGDIIEHLSRPGDMLDGVRGLLAPHGRLIVTTPNAFGLPSFIRYGLGRFREGAEHVMSFNFQNLTNLMHRHGYVVEETGTCHQPMARSSPMFRAGRAFFRVVPQLGGTIFMVARPSTDQTPFPG